MEKRREMTRDSPPERPRPRGEDPASGSPQQALEGLSASQKRLEGRFEELASRLHDRLKRTAGEPAALAVLTEAVDDLAAYQRTLERQQAETLRLAEELLESLAPEAEADAAPVLRPPAPAPSSWRARLKKAFKLTVYLTLGTLRRIWDLAGSRPAGSDQVDRVRGEEGRRPRVAAVRVIAADPEAEEAAWTALRTFHEVQTDADFLTVLWSSASGAYRSYEDGAPGAGRGRAEPWELGPRLGVDYLLTVPADPGTLPATLVESGRLLLASEPLPFLRLDLPWNAERGDAPLFWTVPELWGRQAGLDLEALRARARRARHRVLGKTVGLPGEHRFAPQAPTGSGSYHVAHRAGDYFVPSGRRPPRIFQHPVGGVGAPPSPAAREPAAVLVLLSAPYLRGVELCLTEALAALGEGWRPLLAVATPYEPSAYRRMALLWKRTPHIYPLVDFFAPEVWEGVLAYLIAAYGVTSLLHFDGGRGRAGWGGRLAALRARFPDLRLVVQSLPGPDAMPDGGNAAAVADLYLAHTEEQAAVLAGSHGHGRVERLPRVREDGGALSAERAALLRRELPFGNDEARRIVVVMASDLVAEARPEDFLALAHRLQDDGRFRFLLVGEGPLEVHLEDLRRFLGLRNASVERPRRPLAEYLAAADILCSTAESDPFALAVATAVALGRPVVAAAVDDLPALLHGHAGRLVDRPGDLEGFEAALRELGETDLSVREEASDVPRAPSLAEVYRRVLAPGAAGGGEG